MGDDILPEKDPEQQQEAYADLEEEDPAAVSSSSTTCGGACSVNTWHSYQSRNAILSVLTLNGILSLMTLNGIVAFFSVNAGFSVFAVNSILSIASVNSFLSIGCSGGWIEICGEASAAEAGTDDKNYDGSNTLVVTIGIILCFFGVVFLVQLFFRRIAIVQQQHQ